MLHPVFVIIFVQELYQSPTTTLCITQKNLTGTTPETRHVTIHECCDKSCWNLPFNIDGNKIYQMKCDKSTWKEKLTDGRHWQINWGKNQLLNGERRVAKCHGSVVCTNNNCPMFQVHNVMNEASFCWGTHEGSYQCANCLHFSERQWCGALKSL